MKWTLQQIKEWTGGEIISEKQIEFDEIATDTRTEMTGKIFIALKGDAFDAHAFLDQAVSRGAGALLVHELPEVFHPLKDKVSIILVKDTLQALQDFSKNYRRTLAAKVIGITGSNGKTTTKEFTAQLLGEFKKTHYSQGSFNNHWGVPMTLLSVPADCGFAVVEIGMNHAGEITKLVQIAAPDIVVCTMVGSAHIEFFGTRENIARAKREIYLDSAAETIRIFNQDQDLTFDMMYPVAKKFPESRMLSFSEKNREADVFLKIEKLEMKQMTVSGIIAAVPGSAVIEIFGRQNLTNLMAACTLAYAAGMAPEKIWAALSKCKTAWGRNQFIETQSGAEILFDGYNANPDSMKALLENIPLLTASGSKIGVFGQMKELGQAADLAHFEIGALAGKSGFSQIYFIGENHAAFSDGVKSSGFANPTWIAADFSEDLGQKLKSSLQPGDILVVKGSRGAHTERFIPYCSPKNWAAK